ncbi:MAG: hypothetical protein HYZ83_08380 [Candidatus Omnitrophica bacterium]|nr:hypothetical protein [Candidatus Omnitrophota bacterium]
MIPKNLNPMMLACLISSVMCSGCTILVIGTAAATGGYAVSADGIEGISDKSFDHLWNEAHEVFEQQGIVEWESKEEGKMKAKIGSSTVKFRQEQATPHSVIVRVQARRAGGLFPNRNLARRLYDMIAHEEEGTKES